LSTFIRNILVWITKNMNQHTSECILHIGHLIYVSYNTHIKYFHTVFIDS
jgi:hypothetical protein